MLSLRGPTLKKNKNSTVVNVFLLIQQQANSIIGKRREREREMLVQKGGGEYFSMTLLDWQYCSHLSGSITRMSNIFCILEVLDQI